MKLIKIKIRRFKELVTGILIRSGAKWSLIRLNAVDCRQISSNSSIQRLRKVDRKPQKWTEKVDRKLAMSFWI